MVQVIVYAGAIMVLFLFVIMYLNLKHDVETGVQHRAAPRRRLDRWALLLLAEGGAAVRRAAGRSGPVSAGAAGPRVGNTQAIGQVLYRATCSRSRSPRCCCWSPWWARSSSRKGRGPRAGAADAMTLATETAIPLALDRCAARARSCSCIGVVGVLVRRNALVIFMSIELMLNAANLAFVAFARHLDSLDGQIFVFFVMTVAAAEVAVGLAIIVNLFRLARDGVRGRDQPAQGLTP